MTVAGAGVDDLALGVGSGNIGTGSVLQRALGSGSGNIGSGSGFLSHFLADVCADAAAAQAGVFHPWRLAIVIKKRRGQINPCCLGHKLVAQGLTRVLLCSRPDDLSGMAADDAAQLVWILVSVHAFIAEALGAASVRFALTDACRRTHGPGCCCGG